MTDTQETTLHSLAREMYDAEGDRARATMKVIAAIEADPRLYKALAAPAIRMAAASAVQQVISAQRRDIVAHLSGPSPSTINGHRVLAEFAWLDFTIANGRRTKRAA
jgi:hypothetical protein